VEKIQAEQIATSQLDGGERLLWSGSPDPGTVAMGALPISLFGIPFGGFACFWVWGAWHQVSRSASAPGPWILFPLFGLPFVMVGLGLISMPFWVWLGAKRTVYAITERRAIIISGFGARGVSSFTHSEICDLTRIEKADGSGTLWFATRPFTSSNGMQRNLRVGFQGIPDVRQVEQLIRDNLQEQKAA
jgi:hypothetical protein